MPKPILLPPTEVLNALFSYDPASGVIRYRDSGKIAGCRKKRGWRYLSINSKEYLAHRCIWKMVTGQEPPPELDHENGDRDGNWWSNLRVATRGQNVANSKARTSLKGAYFHSQSGRWTSSIKHDGILQYLGIFATPEEAHEAYCKAADTIFGRFANHG